MQRMTPRFVLALVALSLLAGPTAAAGSDGAVAAPPVVLKGLDPVRLVAGEEVPGSEALSLVHGRFRYLFASAASRDAFAADPERYAVENDGHCAVMPDADGSPDLFAVHDGKVYLFGSPGCREAFVASPGLFTGEIPRRRVAILVYPGVELLDFSGPGEVFAAAAHRGAFEVFTVAATKEPVMSQGFVEVVPQYSIADSPRPDLLVIPGGNAGSVLENPELMAWVKQTAAKAEAVMSVCNGAFVLARAGLLDGLEATTHWASIDALRREAPRTRVRDDVRFVDNGKVVTSAGVSAGIDAALHLVSRLLGEETAKGTARYMEYRYQPQAETAATVAQAGGAGE
jgi:putative intracellular protease/amidase/YHS domain-containing protein